MYLVFVTRPILHRNKYEASAAVSPSDYNQKWNHIVVTYDGRGGPSAYVGMSLFVNGVMMDMENYSSSSSYDGMQPDSSGALYIGAWPTPDSELDGQLAEFAIVGCSASRWRN